MHIVLLILKIIGAILGGLLGLVLFLLCLLLFVPIRYNIHGIAKEDVEVKTSVHWLLHLVHLSVLYQEKKVKFCLRIFGIPVKQNIEKKKKPKKKCGKQKRKAVSKKEERQKKKKVEDAEQKKRLEISIEKEETKKAEQKMEKGTATKAESTQETETFEKIETKTKQNQSKYVLTKQETMETVSAVDSNRVGSKKKTKFHPIQKMKEFWKKMKNAVSTIRKKWVDIKQKIKSIMTKKDKILTFLKDEGTKNTFQKGKSALLGLIRYMGPKNLKGYIRFGTGDPCQTGQVLGVISIAYAYFVPKFKVYPDFEEKIFQADLKAHGRMRLIRFVRVGFQLFFDKEVKKCFADFKQLKED